MNIEYREYQPQDTEPARVLLNAVFSQALQSEESWKCWTETDFTAPVALVDGELAGAIPIKRRLYQVAPGAEVTAWVEHRVGVAEQYRDKGLGSGMQTCAKQFLAGRGDVLLVHRGAERSQGYRFYEKNGLLDVSYPLALRLEPGAATGQDGEEAVQELSEAEFLDKTDAFFGLFRSCYGNAGGYVLRTPDSLAGMVNNVLWRSAIKYQLRFFVAGNRVEPQGYLILGRRTDALHVMELAVRNADPAIAMRLLSRACRESLPVTARATPGGLLDSACQRLGATAPMREGGAMAVMVHILDIESTGSKVWAKVPELRDVAVKVWTPLRDGTIHMPESPARTLTIELKEHMLSRLLMRRLDVAVAVAEERMTVHGQTPGDVAAIARALSPCSWAYQQFDYL